MTRVSENSNKASLNYAINKTKHKLEELQLKGSTLRNVVRPSDNPLANVQALEISSLTSNNNQYLKTSEFALLNLNLVENSLEELSNIIVKAKEIAISQASDFYGQKIRKNISTEVRQLKNQMLAISNKRLGNRYLFSGHKSFTKPFDKDGNYHGDHNRIKLEIAKDFFIPISLNGYEIFYADQKESLNLKSPQDNMNSPIPDEVYPPDDNNSLSRDLASKQTPKESFHQRDNLFSELTSLITALEINDSGLIQNLLPKLDDSLSRLITLRTQIGSFTNSIESFQAKLEKENVTFATRKSNLIDADIAEVFSDIAKQQQVLTTTYKSGQAVLNQSLLDFLK